MQFSRKFLMMGAAVGALVASTGCMGKKYDNPIANNTLQPDKILFDRAINDIEHGRYEVARLTLNTLLNTYDSSEYLAKAKLAIADSWYREGGAHGLAQAEAEYKDFELFYPQMGEAAEAQWRVCQIHFKQMEKVDRDSTQAQRAEDECKLMVQMYPNSKYTGQATQMLREVQEVLAEKEYLAGNFYYTKGAFPAAANRFEYVTQQYPLFSSADDALWDAALSYKHMGDHFEGQETVALSKIVRDYPLSDHVDKAKERLEAMNKPIPPADPAAYARMKYEQEARQSPGILSKATGFIRRNPDTHLAAKSGAPAMAVVRPPTPVSVPAVPNAPGETGVTGSGGGTTDVTASTVSDASTLDSKPDARATVENPASAGTVNNTAERGPQKAATDSQSPLNGPVVYATNHPETDKQRKARLKAIAKAQKKSGQATTTKGQAASDATSQTTSANGARNVTSTANGSTPDTSTKPQQ